MFSLPPVTPPLPACDRRSSRLAGVDGIESRLPRLTQDWSSDDVLSRRRNTIRLMVADDDDVDRERVHRMLERSGLRCEVTDAASGAQALGLLLRSEPPDCIILDHHLGDMTGIDVLQQLNLNGKGIPVIMITGMGDEQLVVHAMRLGIYDYLPKGKLNPERLSDAIEASLRHAALQQRLAEMQEKLERMSLFDDLTGLANRNLFFDRLNQAVLNAEREGSQFALLMMDPNLFKQVNDNLGHEAGDKVLAEIGQRYRSISRKSDTIARLGGDEFTCIPHGVNSVSSATAYAEKIVEAVSEPLAIDDSIVQVGVSIGVALYPQHGADASTLLCNADDAMYRAKRSLRSYAVHEEAGVQRGPMLASVGNYLPRAIDADELYLVYQPTLDLMNQDLVGLEALVRWNSPELGEVFPAQFIPVAERSTLIERITFATIGAALDQLQAWRRDSVMNVPISVNLSARMLDHDGLPMRILQALADHGLRPSDLKLEITETALASSSETAKRVLSELAQAGIGLSIDDFGSGFTSFRYIRDIDISEIKIDRLFIKNLSREKRDMSIVRSMALLSDSMGLRVVAEGIESSENWSVLTDLGCRYGQGYIIGRPMPADQFAHWCQTSR